MSLLLNIQKKIKQNEIVVSKFDRTFNIIYFGALFIAESTNEKWKDFMKVLIENTNEDIVFFEEGKNVDTDKILSMYNGDIRAYFITFVVRRAYENVSKFHVLEFLHMSKIIGIDTKTCLKQLSNESSHYSKI